MQHRRKRLFILFSIENVITLINQTLHLDSNWTNLEPFLIGSIEILPGVCVCVRERGRGGGGGRHTDRQKERVIQGQRERTHFYYVYIEFTYNF